jgi:bifunctional non-homologous end joining protein LigD
MVDSLAGLVGCAQMAALELHTWGTHAEHVEQPDQIIFDLDPDPSVLLPAVMDAARMLRELLAQLGLESFVKTTGGKGLHVVLPIVPELGWDAVKGFSKAVADALVQSYPARFTATSVKAQRSARIFIDYLRNGRGATAIAPYSTRARPGATVATPLAWEELNERLDPTRFNLLTVPARLERLGRDPWHDYGRVSQSLKAAIEKLT